MASLYLLAQPTAKMRLFYTIDKAVGRGCPNQRDDVALVQFFLRAVLEDSKEYKVPAGPSLAIDGFAARERSNTSILGRAKRPRYLVG